MLSTEHEKKNLSRKYEYNKESKKFVSYKFLTGTLAVVTHSLHLKIMRVAAERRVVVGVGGRMTRSITLTIEKRRLDFDGVRNKGNTDLLTFRPHNDLHRFPPLKYPNVN